MTSLARISTVASLRQARGRMGEPMVKSRRTRRQPPAPFPAVRSSAFWCAGPPERARARGSWSDGPPPGKRDRRGNRRPPRSRRCGRRRSRKTIRGHSRDFAVPTTFLGSSATPASAIFPVQIQRAHHLFLRPALDRVRIDHGSLDIRMPQQLLDRPQIHICG